MVNRYGSRRETYSAQMVPLAVDGDDAAVVFLVADIEELVVGEAVLPTSGDVGFDIVEFAEEPGELDVSLVVEVRVPEDEDAVLARWSVESIEARAPVGRE